jgi:hypothetical protein
MLAHAPRTEASRSRRLSIEERHIQKIGKLAAGVSHPMTVRMACDVKPWLRLDVQNQVELVSMAISGDNASRRARFANFK